MEFVTSLIQLILPFYFFPVLLNIFAYFSMLATKYKNDSEIKTIIWKGKV